MNERLIDTSKEFDELSQNEKTEFLDAYQEQLEEKNDDERDEKLPDQLSFLGNSSETKAERKAKDYVKWAADNGFTGHHAIKAKHQLEKATKAKEEADKLINNK